MSNNKFLKGAAILGIAGILVKVMGMFFRVPLTRWLGAAGIADYSSVYPVYTLFLIISTAGIPVAISRMVSERIAVKNYAGAHKVFQTSVWLLGAVGLVSFAVVYFGAEFLETVVLNNEGSRLSLEAIAPALFIVPVMSAYRGYFQGRQNMNPTAVSQFFEQLARVGIGLALAYFLLDSGASAACAGATFGATAGAGAGLFVVVIIYIINLKVIKGNIARNKSHSELESTGEIVKKILIIAVPITIGAAILPMVNFIDSAMVMRRLMETGWTEAQAEALWGRLGGYCSSLIGMPQVFIQAIAMSLVPAISAGFKVKNYGEVRENMQFAMRAAMIVGFPCAAGMFALAEPILKLLYLTETNGAEVAAAAPTLMIMTLSIIFMSTLQTLTGALQGIGKQMIPVKNLAIGAVAKVVVTYVFVGLKAVNINGAPIGTIVCYIIASVLNIRDVKKYTGTSFNFGMTFGKPFAASAVMGVVVFASYKMLFFIMKSNTIATLLSVCIGVAVYGVLILMTRAITKDEIRRLPKGDKLVRILDRFVK
ncbi:MAG: polysaccharide biosynthesis protein [Firmicutes bacterium]|nr:polysaccharide biosynthesis protein [Bacillota bacterium]